VSIVAAVSASSTTQQDLLVVVDALVGALMAHLPPAEITSVVDRLEGILRRQGSKIPMAAFTELRLAIELVRSGQPCAAVSALIAARSELRATPR
jgi:hypothetical protein